MPRKLFCQISPTAYRISVLKCQLVRHVYNLRNRSKLAKTKQHALLPFIIYSHKSLIRRKLGNVDLDLQENKAANLALAAPKVSHIIVMPSKIFSFWSLVGNCSGRKGYKEGLTISGGRPARGVGGGMCQFTNLIHWLVLHTPLQVVEHHHHDGLDLFPDYGRQVPFGVGTSILYNYLDYRVANNTSTTFQLVTWTTDKYLCGEIRASDSLAVKYHIKSENEHFTCEAGVTYRNGQVYRECVDVHTGNLVARELLKENHAKVMYDTAELTIEPARR